MMRQKFKVFTEFFATGVQCKRVSTFRAATTFSSNFWGKNS